MAVSAPGLGGSALRGSARDDPGPRGRCVVVQMQKAGVMSLSIRVHICADPVSEAGIVSQLRHESDLVTVTNGSIRPSAIGDVTGMPTVSVVVADRVNDDTIERIRE